MLGKFPAPLGSRALVATLVAAVVVIHGSNNNSRALVATVVAAVVGIHGINDNSRALVAAVVVTLVVVVINGSNKYSTALRWL